LKIGGVAFYHVPAEILTRYRNPNLLEMESRADAAWFGDLLRGGNSYLSQGFALQQLNPVRAAQLGFLPPAVWQDNLDTLLIQRRIGGPMLWLGPWRGIGVGVALIGSHHAIEPLIERYRADADTIYFPYPDKLANTLRIDDTPEMLLMVFGRQGLARAATRSGLESNINSSAAASHS
jgi:hypothetical protein